MIGTQLAVFIASLCGIVPPMGFLWYMLIPHEDDFEDRDVFLSFGYGFIVGGVLAIIQWALIASYIESIDKVAPISTFIVGAMMGLVITLIITFWANRKKFFHTKASRFIGIGVACGISTSFIFAKVYADLRQPFEDHGENIHFYLKNALYVVSILLMNTAAGITVGNEISKGEYKLGILKCTILLILFYPLMTFHLVYYDNDQQWVFPALLTIVGALAFLYQYIRNVNQEQIPLLKGLDKKKRKKGKGRRRRK